jgi:hypothetical protein
VLFVEQAVLDSDAKLFVPHLPSINPFFVQRLRVHDVLVDIEQRDFLIKNRPQAKPRTADARKQMYEQFVQSGGIIKNAKNFGNQIRPSLISAPPSRIAIPSLHIDLGVGKYLLDFVSGIFLNFDQQLLRFDARSGQAEASEEHQFFLSKAAEAQERCFDVQNRLKLVQDQLQHVESMLEPLKYAVERDKGEKVSGQRKLPGKFMHRTDKAIADRAKYKEIAERFRVAELQKSEEKLEGEEQAAKANLSAQIESLEKADGSYTTAWKTLMSKLGVERNRYHGGSFNGNDIGVMLQPNVIRVVSSFLKPRLFVPAPGKRIELGSFELAQAVGHLLKKYSSCRLLFMAARPLCQH